MMFKLEKSERDLWQRAYVAASHHGAVQPATAAMQAVRALRAALDPTGDCVHYICASTKPDGVDDYSSVFVTQPESHSWQEAHLMQKLYGHVSVTGFDLRMINRAVHTLTWADLAKLLKAREESCDD
jgi:hypothetical protein